MSFVLSEEYLEKGKCSFCKQYLSCGPTKVYANGDIACGRCAPNRDGGAPSLFDKIASYGIFPCVNRYEGCNQLLQYGNIPEHEKKCKGNQVRCLNCDGSATTFSLLSLIDHYKQEHVEYILKTPEFDVCTSKINLSSSHFLFCDNFNNLIFIIRVVDNTTRLTLDAAVSRKKRKTQVKQVFENMKRQKFCSELNTAGDGFIMDFPTVDKRPETITCKFSFEVLHVATSVLSDYSRPIPQSKLNNFPKILFNNGSENNYKLSSCATKFVNEKRTSIVQFKCNFCETNFWNCTWDMRYCLYSCGQCIICSDCFLNGYLKCTHHKKEFKVHKNSEILFAKFYCRNDCGGFFTIFYLLCHEIECLGGHSAKEFVKQQFKVIAPSFVEFIRGNKVKNPGDSPIYMVTYDGLKFILTNKKGNTGINFKISHDYDKTKYYVLIRIIDRSNKIIREEVNEFSLNDYTHSSFVVLLREMNTGSLFIP